jgi:hypothetical protein
MPVVVFTYKSPGAPGPSGTIFYNNNVNVTVSSSIQFETINQQIAINSNFDTNLNNSFEFQTNVEPKFINSNQGVILPFGFSVG